MSRIMDMLSSVCYYPINKSEELFDQFKEFSSNIMKNKFQANDEFIRFYRKISLKRCLIVSFQIFASFIFFYYFITYTFWFFKPHILLSAPLVIDKSSTFQPTIVTIATNGHSAKDLVERVRSKGQYNGDIYIIGDSCSDMQESTDANIIFIQVEKLGNGIYKNDQNKTSKQLKEKLYILIDEYQYHLKRDMASNKKENVRLREPVQQILYLDSDIDVNGPIQPFISSIGKEWGKKQPENEHDCNVYMFRERKYTRAAFSTVILLLDRYKSKSFLEKWGEVITQHPEFPRDHLALSLFLARDGQQEEITDTSQYREFRLVSICELPFEGGMSYGSDFVTQLRGSHATTFTHSSGHENVAKGTKGALACH